MEWFPIESAPKDGSMILAYNENIGAPSVEAAYYWGPCWVNADGGNEINPTHWAEYWEPEPPPKECAIEWFPIESAPRDGTKILLLMAGVAIEGAYIKYQEQVKFWEIAVLPSHGCGCCQEENPAPTHWAPLSKPIR